MHCQKAQARRPRLWHQETSCFAAATMAAVRLLHGCRPLLCCWTMARNYLPERHQQTIPQPPPCFRTTARIRQQRRHRQRIRQSLLYRRTTARGPQPERHWQRMPRTLPCCWMMSRRHHPDLMARRPHPEPLQQRIRRRLLYYWMMTRRRQPEMRWQRIRPAPKARRPHPERHWQRRSRKEGAKQQILQTCQRHHHQSLLAQGLMQQTMWAKRTPIRWSLRQCQSHLRIPRHQRRRRRLVR